MMSDMENPKQLPKDLENPKPPPSDKLEKPKQRRGEILPADLEKRNKTTKLKDTNYEVGNPNWGTARFNNRMLLELRVRDNGERFTFEYDSIDQIVVGRRDPATDARPDVDLEPFDALNKGVSRTHALIMRRDGALMVLDQGTPNGTFLNGQKLVAQQPRILRDGDDIRLGHLVVRISFRRRQQGDQRPVASTSH